MYTLELLYKLLYQVGTVLVYRRQNSLFATIVYYEYSSFSSINSSLSMFMVYYIFLRFSCAFVSAV